MIPSLIPKHVLDKIATSEISGPKLAEVLSMVATVARDSGDAGGEIILHYQPDEEVPPGTMLPQIILRVVTHEGRPAPETEVEGD